SPAERGSVRARIGGDLDRPVRPADERTRMAERLVIGAVEHIHRMARAVERPDQAVIEAALEGEVDARFPPGAPQQAARCVPRLGETPAEMHVAREDLGLELRLPIAA